jgi:hypothetical protein
MTCMQTQDVLASGLALYKRNVCPLAGVRVGKTNTQALLNQRGFFIGGP